MGWTGKGKEVRIYGAIESLQGRQGWSSPADRSGLRGAVTLSMTQPDPWQGANPPPPKQKAAGASAGPEALIVWGELVAARRVWRGQRSLRCGIGPGGADSGWLPSWGCSRGCGQAWAESPLIMLGALIETLIINP